MTASFAYLRPSLYGIACLLWALLLLFALAVPAAAQAAFPELVAAEQAVQRATQADADQYAADLVNLARQELMQAQQAQLDRRQRQDVPQIALRAAADADLARARSEAAVVGAQLEQRRKEVALLQNTLNTGENGP